MRIGLLRSTLLLSLVVLLACDKTDLGPGGQEKKSELSQFEIESIEKSFAKQRTLLEEVKQLKQKAENGDPAAAARWRAITSQSGPIVAAEEILNRTKKSPILQKRLDELHTIQLEMSQMGWGDLLPAWISAKLGEADAQNEIFEFFSRENLYYSGLRKVRFKRAPFDLWGPGRRHKLECEVMANGHNQASYSYLVDPFWTPPAGAWDPLYVEGRYRCEGIEFSPREWLAKAAAGDSKYRAKLAAHDFILAKDDAERTAAARMLLSNESFRSHAEDRSLVDSCLATLYIRGIVVPVNLSKAAQIMLSSRDEALTARGVKLVCENNLPLRGQDVDQGGPTSEALMIAVCSKYGVGNWGRDLERAYFEYWRFLRHSSRPTGDANFARMELAEIEKRLTPEQVVSLQENCWIWEKKFGWKTPYIDDWKAR